MTTEQPVLTEAETERLTRRGLRLAQFTVVYNVAEGAIAITARKKMISSTGMSCTSFTPSAISAKKKLASSM